MVEGEEEMWLHEKVLRVREWKNCPFPFIQTFSHLHSVSKLTSVKKSVNKIIVLTFTKAGRSIQNLTFQGGNQNSGITPDLQYVFSSLIRIFIQV